MVCISCGLLPVSAMSSAQVGAEHLMDPIFAPTPAQSKISLKINPKNKNHGKIMYKKNHSYKHNEQINKQNIDNSE
jgi:hypothetical protein